jgi:hypothetical protein
VTTVKARDIPERKACIIKERNQRGLCSATQIIKRELKSDNKKAGSASASGF